jgi:hypothetical protein
MVAYARTRSAALHETRGATSAGSRPSVAVVVPFSKRATLEPDEEISLTHLRHYLGRYDRFILAPKSLDVPFPDFEIRRFDDRFFGSVAAHTALMLSAQFYQAFRHYEFVLTYHLDALALSDQLPYWCGREWDFIGAPNHGTLPYLSVPCNGGFALRRVESFLRVLTSRRLAIDPETYWASLRRTTPALLLPLQLPRRYLKRFYRFNNVHREIGLMLAGPEPPLEDVFIVENATKYDPAFRIPPVREAVRFAFDETPREAFALNDNQLPFGAHGWYKHDRAFWDPYLLR